MNTYIPKVVKFHSWIPRHRSMYIKSNPRKGFIFKGHHFCLVDENMPQSIIKSRFVFNFSIVNVRRPFIAHSWTFTIQNVNKRAYFRTLWRNFPTQNSENSLLSHVLGNVFKLFTRQCSTFSFCYFIHPISAKTRVTLLFSLTNLSSETCLKAKKTM